MAGTDRTKRDAAARTGLGGPAIIQVRPQLPENIGMAARAMLNFGLTGMRLVAPRCPWPSEHAINTSSGAHSVLENAKLFETTEDAVADLHHIFATTARRRDMVKPVETLRAAAARLRAAASAGQHAGILFGPERSGLHNDELALAETLVNVPANPAFSSVNLAHAVLLLSYEWGMGGDVEALAEHTRKGTGPATQGDLIGFYEHLERELDDCGFLRLGAKRPRMVRNIRAIFSRNALSDQEVRTLRGIVTCLAEKRRK